MIPHPFFPHPLFAWTYYVVLVGITVAATYTDLRRLIIPRQLTLTGLALGLLFNAARGAWIGASGAEHGVWTLAPGGVVLGALDGLLFALAGFAVGFGLFFLMWLLGTCGGGDLKLFAAVGAWTGPTLAIVVLAGTLILVVVLSVGRLAWSFVKRGFRPTFRDYSMQQAARGGKRAGKQGHAEARRPRQRLMAYSLPVAMSTAFVLLWVFRGELQLPVPPTAAATVEMRLAQP